MPKVTIVPEHAERAGLLPTRAQRRAQEAAARGQATIEQHPDVIAAYAAAEAAEQHLAQLEQRVLDGDRKVTATDTGQAREEARFAQLRLDAARNTARAQLAQQRQHTYDTAVQQTRDAIGDDDVLEQLRNKATDALTAYLAAVGHHNQALRQAYATLRAAGVTRHGSAFEADKAGDDTAVYSHDSLILDGRRHEPLKPEKLADHVVWKAARNAGVKGPSNRDLRVEAKNTIIPTGWAA